MIQKARNPPTILGTGPIFLFVMKLRPPLDLLRRDQRQRREVFANGMLTKHHPSHAPDSLTVSASCAFRGDGGLHGTVCGIVRPTSIS